MAFNREQISSILSKAAEIELSKNLASDNEELTETELLALAKEVGISLDSMQAAIASVNTPEFDNRFEWLKGTSRLQHYEVFNTPFKKEHRAKVLQLLQSSYNELGEAELHANTLTWVVNREASSQKFILKEDHGKTSLTFSSNWTEIKILAAVLPLFLAFIFTLITVKGLGFDKSTAVLLAPVGGFFGLSSAWLYLRHRFNKQKIKLDKTLTSIRSLLYSHKEPAISMEDVPQAQDNTKQDSKRTKA